MLNKELIIKHATLKFEGELLNIVLRQIDNYFYVMNSNYVIRNKYQIGDEVILGKEHLLHGIGNHIEVLETISKRGIVSQDYFGDNSNHAFCYESAFWTVKDEIKLKEYIKNYSGMVVKYNETYEMIPYMCLDKFVEKMKSVEHWLWTAESSMEIRFMPSLAKNINQIGFILNVSDEIGKKMRENSVFKEKFKKEYAFEFVSEKNRDKFLKEGFISDFFTRADYIIFGLPRNYIEGILVGREVENNLDFLNRIKQLFPLCYICNLDGKVIF